MTCWIGVPPRPPYSFGHVIPARPASALRRWKSLARRRASASPERDSHVSNMPPRGSAFFCRNARASARNPASSGVSLQSMRSLLRRARFEARDQEILPAARAPEGEPEERGAAVVEVAVELPGEAH